jgi:hypothetical protein
MKTPVDFNNFIQVAIVVKDIEKAAKAWCEFFNVPMPEIRVQEPGQPMPNLTYRGKPAAYGRKLAAIKVPSRGFTIELLQPTGGESSFQEYLNKHDQGVHHLGFEVGEKRDAIIGEFEEKGFALRTIGMYTGGSWTVVDSENVLGVNLSIKSKA